MLARMVSEILSLDIDPLVEDVTRKLLLKHFKFSSFILNLFVHRQGGTDVLS